VRRRSDARSDTRSGAPSDTRSGAGRGWRPALPPGTRLGVVGVFDAQRDQAVSGRVVARKVNREPAAPLGECFDVDEVVTASRHADRRQAALAVVASCATPRSARPPVVWRVPRASMGRPELAHRGFTAVERREELARMPARCRIGIDEVGGARQGRSGQPGEGEQRQTGQRTQQRHGLSTGK